MRPECRPASPNRLALLHFCVSIFVVAISNCLAIAEDPVKDAQRLIEEYVAEVRPLEIATAKAWWEANTTGTAEAFKLKEECQNRLDAALSNSKRFEQLTALRKSTLNDAQLARQIELLYLAHLEKQLDRELMANMVSKANAIEKAFNVFRANVDGQTLTDSEVRKVLSESRDSDLRKKVWIASKTVGAGIEIPLKELVQYRNQAAKSLGFRNYQELALRINEQTSDQILAIFDELDALTAKPFADAKEAIDTALAKSYGIQIADLRPWHYHDPFFQQPPSIYATNLDDVFRDVDIQSVCRNFYHGIGLPIDDVLARSDLFEKQGKSPHAFCTDIDREGDVRVLANIVPNEYWMTTMLHELGHAVYSSKNIPVRLPYLLRGESHILTTEGMAMMFERMAGHSKWLEAMKIKVANSKDYDETAAAMRRNKLLIFSRWCQVMFRFEKAMYENPEQDLNDLWWDLVEKYQLMKRPEGRNSPDYASKIHIVSAPVYYHNYLLGELFACQLHACVARDVLQSENAKSAVYWDNPKVGQYIQKHVFDQGKTLKWDEMILKATGKKLQSQDFANEFSNTSAK